MATGTILLTGAAGFIGQKTAQLLIDRGWKVAGMDNLNDYYDPRLKNHRLEQLLPLKGFRFYQGDIEEYNSLEELFRENRFEAVINLAARAGVRYSIENPHVYMSTNAQGTLNLLELMRKYGPGKFILASTSSLYAGQPMPFTEDLPVNTPISPYAASKKAAELMAYTYHNLFGMDVSILRYFTVYGPAGRPDMSPFRFIKLIDEGNPIELFGDGTQSRDFTYVDDIAEGTIKALAPLGYEIINLGGGKNPIPISRLISEIEDNLGKKAVVDRKPFHKADVKDTWADISKAGKLLSWSPEVDFSEGVRRTTDWYLQNRNWIRDIRL